MPSGSKARIVAPASRNAGRNARLGLSRISSVLGLKVSPSAARRSPATLPPQAAVIRSAMRRLRASLTRSTGSTIASGASACKKKKKKKKNKKTKKQTQQQKKQNTNKKKTTQHNN